MLRDAEGDFRRELEAGRRRWQKQQAPRSVGEEHIRAVLSQWTGVPVCDPDEADRKALAGLETALCRDLLGQDQAAQAVARAIRRGRLGAEGPPAAGGAASSCWAPPGVGKTQLCRSPGPHPVRQWRRPSSRFDMSEYMEPHSVSRLIGLPSGLRGPRGGGDSSPSGCAGSPGRWCCWTSWRRPHRDVWSILLQGDGGGGAHRRPGAENRLPKYRTGDDPPTWGARHFHQKARLGFSQGPEADRSALEQAVLREARNTFAPEVFSTASGRRPGVPPSRPADAGLHHHSSCSLRRRGGSPPWASASRWEPEAVRLLAQTGGPTRTTAPAPSAGPSPPRWRDPAADLIAGGLPEKGRYPPCMGGGGPDPGAAGQLNPIYAILNIISKIIFGSFLY